MRIYLDACCLNRPFNDQSQPRVRSEAEAVLRILEQFDRGAWTHVSSEMVLIEISSIKKPELRDRILSMLPASADIMPVGEEVLKRAEALGAFGLKPADAAHVAAAELYNADVLLTCDDRLLKAVARHADQIRIRVMNPVSWIADYEDKENT